MNRECPVALAARARPDSVALIFQGRTYTWAEADREVAAFTDSLDVAAGDRVAVRAWNCPELAWLFFAASRRGAVFVPLNARLTSHELAPLLERLDARVSFGDLPGALSLSLRERVGVRASVASEVAAALFTSGTTGAPKLVELTHANFTASARANAERLGGEPTQRWLGTLPLFHVGGLAMLYRCALYGASIALEASFDAERACAAMDEGVTHVSLVPTMLERVLEVRGARPFTGVKAALIGGGPMTSSTLRRARAAGLPVLQTYGLTEACSQVTTEVPEEADGLTAGRPIPGVEVRITEPDEGGVGEIEVRGPTVAKGLGPWLKTKDLGSLDARGRLSVRSRRMDLILTGGENVYPAEVEAVLREYPGIRDVAVVARPDSEWGQVPVAVVVASEFEAAAVTAWVRERLAAYKIPRAWVLVDVLPRNATGKLDRLGLLKLI
ncbi:MAG: o-succinylbenzoate--CoA ligase [Archangium sp.]|nr:o-succinylbenzoate--CoA ligase [Archangium sp.]